MMTSYPPSSSSASSHVLASRPVSEELLWSYGDGYQSIREHAGYEVGSPCADEMIDSLRLPSPRSRVLAILQDGRRAADALYELSLGGSDTSGEDWTPAKRRRK